MKGTRPQQEDIQWHGQNKLVDLTFVHLALRFICHVCILHNIGTKTFDHRQNTGQAYSQDQTIIEFLILKVKHLDWCHELLLCSNLLYFNIKT